MASTGRRFDEFEPRDYPVLFRLASVLRPGDRIFCLGGGVGNEFHAYRSRLPLAGEVPWLVCEVPRIAQAGRDLALRMGVEHLEFTSSPDDASGSQILVSCVALQYLEQDLGTILGRLDPRPTHLLINRVPLHESRSFVTLQKIGHALVPYVVRSVAGFLDGLERAGYEVVDRREDQKVAEVSFHPDLSVRGYRGFYLRLRSDRPDVAG